VKFWHFSNSDESVGAGWFASIFPAVAGTRVPYEMLVHGFAAALRVPVDMKAEVHLKSEKPICDVIVTGNGILARSAIATNAEREFSGQIQVVQILSDNHFLDDYACLNCLIQRDCIDLKKSRITFRLDDPHEIAQMHSLWLNQDTRNAQRVIFRVRGQLSLVIVDDLAKGTLVKCGVPEACFREELLAAFNAFHAASERSRTGEGPH
jgi:hypothetical protein